jgi:transposase
MDHIGIDVHKRDSQICIVAEGGEVIEQRIRTEPERFAAVLGKRPRARSLIEASTDSEWVARCLEGSVIRSSSPTRTLPRCTRPWRIRNSKGPSGAGSHRMDHAVFPHEGVEPGLARARLASRRART